MILHGTGGKKRKIEGFGIKKRKKTKREDLKSDTDWFLAPSRNDLMTRNPLYGLQEVWPFVKGWWGREEPPLRFNIASLSGTRVVPPYHLLSFSSSFLFFLFVSNKLCSVVARSPRQGDPRQKENVSGIVIMYLTRALYEDNAGNIVLVDLRGRGSPFSIFRSVGIHWQRAFPFLLASFVYLLIFNLQII